MDSQAQYLTEHEVSQITGFKLPTLRNWRFLRKEPRYRKIGRSVRYELKDILTFMDGLKIETKSIEE